MNIIIFTGNIGKDAEIRTTTNGKTICTFSVPCTSGYGDFKKTTWMTCKLLGKRVEGKLPGMLLKGLKVCISGEFSMDEWEKDGVKHSRPVVVVNDIDFNSIGAKSDGQRQAEGLNKPIDPMAAKGQATQANHQGFDDFDDDIPF